MERGVEQQPDHWPGALNHARTGAVAGSRFTALVFWAMLVASGATLGRSHAAVANAVDAAEALRPVAGSGTEKWFAAGLVISAVVALLVRLARNPEVMRERPISRRLSAAGWAVAAVVGAFGLLFAIGAAAGKV